jgi:hypothetical protein
MTARTAGAKAMSVAIGSAAVAGVRSEPTTSSRFS